jgi:hypothetical protein
MSVVSFLRLRLPGDPEHGLGILLLGQEVVAVGVEVHDLSEPIDRVDFQDPMEFEVDSLDESPKSAPWRNSILRECTRQKGLLEHLRISNCGRFLEILTSSSDLTWRIKILDLESLESVCSGTKPEKLKLNKLGKVLLKDVKRPTGLEFLDRTLGLAQRACGGWAEMPSGAGPCLFRRKGSTWTLVDADGVIVKSFPYDRNASFSADASRFCLTRELNKYSGEFQLLIVDVVDGSSTVVSEGLRYQEKAFSRCGKWIVGCFYNATRTHSGMFTVDLESGVTKTYPCSLGNAVTTFEVAGEEYVLVISNSDFEAMKLSSSERFKLNHGLFDARGACVHGQQLVFTGNGKLLFVLSVEKLLSCLKPLA